jgi:hypothetical protein
MDAQELTQRLELSFQSVAEAQDHLAPLTHMPLTELQSELGCSPAVAESLMAWRGRIIASLSNGLRFIDAMRGVVAAPHQFGEAAESSETGPAVDGVSQRDPIFDADALCPRLPGETEEAYNARKAAAEREWRESRRSELESQDAMTKATAVWR